MNITNIFLVKQSIVLFLGINLQILHHQNSNSSIEHRKKEERIQLFIEVDSPQKNFHAKIKQEEKYDKVGRKSRLGNANLWTNLGYILHKCTTNFSKKVAKSQGH